ncbi:MAG: NADH-quinone oxidoreductase subunit C, partial [Muribaculaceae bacterium]|nr:NADH-quinone oxidoreductase subunit C [Muribaculaceae bacterium]
MSDLIEKISRICPSAQFTEGETLLVTVEEKDWYPLAKALKETEGLRFDVLSAVVGMDWKDSLGVMYYLTSTSRGWDMISVKVAVTDRENPMIHSVSDLWKVALFQEREVFDFYGIKFINHPDMRRFFLRNDWVGYPLRKDYDTNPDLNPLRMTDEENEDATVSYVEQPDGKVEAVPGTVFEAGDYVV